MYLHLFLSLKLVNHITVLSPLNRRSIDNDVHHKMRQHSYTHQSHKKVSYNHPCMKTKWNNLYTHKMNIKHKIRNQAAYIWIQLVWTSSCNLFTFKIQVVGILHNWITHFLSLITCTFHINAILSDKFFQRQ